MWHQADHPAIWVVPAQGFVAILGNSVFMHFEHTASEVHHLFSDITSSGGAMMSCVTSQHCTCIGHMTFCYKRSADTSFKALLAHLALSSRLLVHPLGSPLSPAYGWCLMCVGRDVSSASLGLEPTSFKHNYCVSLSQ